MSEWMKICNYYPMQKARGDLSLQRDLRNQQPRGKCAPAESVGRQTLHKEEMPLVWEREGAALARGQPEQPK